MKTFNVKIYELDNRENLTDNILFQTKVTTKSKAMAGQIAAMEFKSIMPETYVSYRHNYFIVCEEVTG